DNVLIPKLKKDFDIVFVAFGSRGSYFDLSAPLRRFSNSYSASFDPLHPVSLPLSFIDAAILQGKRINWKKAWKEEGGGRIEIYNASGEEIPLTDERLKSHKEMRKDYHIKNATIHIPRKILEMFWKKVFTPIQICLTRPSGYYRFSKLLQMGFCSS
ncbi:MAG: hypothetical protein L6408_03460, partial [Nanoarchaeota archaeon]|nr:hypothetical protein [Nanoarchaeota archaeon]